MARRKNSSGNWLETLRQLTEIIKTEYPDGGNLPPVPEMSQRLKVAENTYCKALRTVCQHGLAHAKQGRAGTVILPSIHRHVKIGVLYPGERPLLPGLPLQHLFNLSIKNSYAVQMLSGKTPDTLNDEILILNIDALYVINPPAVYFPYLQKLHENGFPVAIVEFYNFSQIDEAMQYDLPYFHTSADTIAGTLRYFADNHNFGPVMLLDIVKNSLLDSFKKIFSGGGRTFRDNHFLLFSQIDKSLPIRIKKNRIELIYAKCNEVHGELICNKLLELPEDKRRP